MIGMNVGREFTYAFSGQPFAHRLGGLGGEALVLPIGPDHPGELCRIIDHGCLNEPDRDPCSDEAENPVVPRLVLPRRAYDLSPITRLDFLQIGGIGSGEAVEVCVGEDTDHFGGVGDPEGCEHQPLGAKLGGCGRRHRFNRASLYESRWRSEILEEPVLVGEFAS
jgi:hypothetical protein